MPDAYVVDTSVFVRWFIPQPGHEHAIELLEAFIAGAVALATVDFARVELGNVLRKKAFLVRRCSLEELVAWTATVDDLGVQVHAVDREALARSVELAGRRVLSVYDALLVDRAIVEGRTLVTADQRLHRAVSGVVSTELLRGAVP